MVVQGSFSGLKTSSHDDYKFSIVSSPQGCFIMALDVSIMECCCKIFPFFAFLGQSSSPNLRKNKIK